MKKLTSIIFLIIGLWFVVELGKTAIDLNEHPQYTFTANLVECYDEQSRYGTMYKCTFQRDDNNQYVEKSYSRPITMIMAKNVGTNYTLVEPDERPEKIAVLILLSVLLFFFSFLVSPYVKD